MRAETQNYARHKKTRKLALMHIDMDKLAPFLTNEEEAQMKLDLQDTPAKTEAKPAKKTKAKVKKVATPKAQAKTKQATRRLWTTEKKRAVLKRLAAKPKTQPHDEFCRAEGVSTSMVSRWKNSGRFGPVQVTAEPTYVLPKPVKPDKHGRYPEAYKKAVVRARLKGAPVALLATKLRLNEPTIYKWAQDEKKRRDPHATASEYKAEQAAVKTKAAVGTKPYTGSLKKQIERSRIALITAIAALAIRSGVLGQEFTGLLESLE